MTEATQSQGCPLTMFAQTCSKIQPMGSTSDTNQSTEKSATEKKSPIKIAPKYYALKNANPGISPQQLVLKAISADARKVCKSDLRPIFTVPLTDLDQSEGVAVVTQSTNNSNVNGNTAGQPKLIEQPRAPEIFRLVDTSAPVTFIRTYTQKPVVLSPKITATTVPNVSFKNSHLASKGLKQISANTIIPSIRESTSSNPQQNAPPVLPPQIRVCTQENTGQANANATVQIMMPPNTPLSSLQEILQLAANAAKQYQPDGNQVNSNTPKDSINDITSNNNTSDINDYDTIDKSQNSMLTIPDRPTIIRKVRTQCTCPNCLDRKISPNPAKNEKRTHICSFNNCKKRI